MLRCSHNNSCSIISACEALSRLRHMMRSQVVAYNALRIEVSETSHLSLAKAVLCRNAELVGIGLNLVDGAQRVRIASHLTTWHE